MGLKPSFLDDTCRDSLSVTPACTGSGSAAQYRATQKTKTSPHHRSHLNGSRLTEETVYPLPGGIHGHGALESFSSSIQG